MYQALFSHRAERSLMRLTNQQARRVREAIVQLAEDPRRHGAIKLENAPVGQYRYRVGDFRILFDIDDNAKTVEILDIRRRDEQTYRKVL